MAKTRSCSTRLDWQNYGTSISSSVTHCIILGDSNLPSTLCETLSDATDKRGFGSSTETESKVAAKIPIVP